MTKKKSEPKVIDIKTPSKCDTCAHKWELGVETKKDDVKLPMNFNYCLLVNPMMSIEDVVLSCNKFVPKSRGEA